MDPVQPTPQPIPEKPTPVKNNNFLITLLSILLLVAVGAAGFFAYQTQKLVAELKSMNSKLNIPAPEVSPTPTPDPTADWNIYTNTDHQILFKYPDNWTLDEQKGQNENGTIYNTSINLIRDDYKIVIYLNMDGIGGQGQDREGIPITVLGENLYEYTANQDYNNTVNVGIANSLKNSLGLFSINKKTYSIVLNYPQEISNEKELVSEFNQILSTFEFIETNSPSPTATSSSSPSN